MRKIISKISFLFISIGIIIIFYKFSLDLIHTKEMNKLTNNFLNEVNIYENDENKNNKENVIGILEFPRFKEKIAVSEGIDLKTLSSSAGHFSETPYPWDEYGNSVFAAHNNTFFKNIDKFDLGDNIIFYSKKGIFQYNVVKKLIVLPNDISVIKNVYGYKKITLITCNFIGSKRIVVFAEGGVKLEI